MKKILLSVSLLMPLSSVLAQSTVEMKERVPRKQALKIGIKGGLNCSNVAISRSAGIIENPKTIAGWQAGIYTDIPILPMVSLQTGLSLTSKGFKFMGEIKTLDTYLETTTRPIYIEVPINGVIKIPVANKIKLFAGAGPYVAVGVAGKYKSEGRNLGIPFSQEVMIRYGKEDKGNYFTYGADFKRIDFGLNLLGGIEVSHLTINANYGLGLSNIKSELGSEETKFKNRVFSILVGVLF